MEGMLLVAHGSRDPEWSEPFLAVAGTLQQLRPDVRVMLAYGQFQQPGIDDAARSLVQEGCQHVLLVPLFLGAGVHVKEDMQHALTRMAQAWPQVQWNLSQAVGEMPAFHQAVAELLARATI